MNPNFNFHDYFNARVSNINTRPELHGPDRKLAMDIRFIADVPANVLKKLAVGESPDYETMLFDKDGNILPLSLVKIDSNRTFEDYMMTISFSELRKDEDFDVFKADKLCKFKILKFLQGKRVRLQWDAQIHPYEEKDIGHIIKKGIEMHECHLKFEMQQKDLATQAEDAKKQEEVDSAKSNVTNIAANKAESQEAEPVTA